jgi:uncharacterized repeat protein (TIGR01451 family)
MKVQSIKRVLQAGGITIGLAMVALAAGAFFSMGNSRASAAPDMSPDAIMHGGASSQSVLIAKVNSGNGGTERDLAAIYAAYGLPAADYNRFIASAQAGIAYKNGTIVVGTRTVATGGQSLGRDKKSYAHARVIAGKTYWESSSQDVFRSDTIPVWVLFNSQGAMQFAVMKDCGNPMRGQPVVPAFSCRALQQKQIDRTTFAFDTDYTAVNGAAIDHVLYDFGDGSTTTRTNPREVVQHSYTRDGTFTAKVTVFVKLPGMSTLHQIVAVGGCVKQVVVRPEQKPVAAKPAIMIEKDVDGVKEKQVDVGQEFTYHVKVSNTGNVDLKNVQVTDTPPAGVTLVRADLGTIDIANNTWSFTAPNLLAEDSVTFTITAKVLNFMSGSLVNKACVNAPSAPNQPMCDTATVTVTQPEAPTPTPTPTPPPPVETLPNTGAGSIIGIFTGVAATGIVAYRTFLTYREIANSRRR